MGVLRSAQDKLLTSNWTEQLNILSMGEISVYPLDGVDNNLSIQSIISILSTLFAPKLHLKSTQINWFGGLILTIMNANHLYC